MTIKEFFSFKSNRYFWLNIIAMVVTVIVLLFFVMQWLSFYTHHGESVEIPHVNGLTVGQANDKLRERDLNYVVSDSAYNQFKPAGVILFVNPAEGQQVKKGRTVYITINTLSAPLHAIPDVADNSSSRQAEAKLLSAGFKLTDNELVPGERDWVYGVKCHGRQLVIGEKVPQGALLTLLVGDGEEVNESEDSDSLNVQDESDVGEVGTDQGTTKVENNNAENKKTGVKKPINKKPVDKPSSKKSADDSWF